MSDTFERCETCPASGSCRAVELRCRRLCDLANPSHPEFGPAHREHLRDWVAPPAEPQPEPPSLAERAAMVASAVARYAAAGFPTLDEDAYEARLTICRGCEFVDGDALRCKACTCNLRFKARMATEDCPKGKWATASPR